VKQAGQNRWQNKKRKMSTANSRLTPDSVSAATGQPRAGLLPDGDTVPGHAVQRIIPFRSGNMKTDRRPFRPEKGENCIFVYFVDDLFSKNGRFFSKNGRLFTKDGRLFSEDGRLCRKDGCLSGKNGGFYAGNSSQLKKATSPPAQTKHPKDRADEPFCHFKSII
jgi:hypothetical protein